MLYNILSQEVLGFDTIIEALSEGPKSDQELGEVISESHPEFGWEDKSGPAQHRGWLQSLGYIERTDQINQLTSKGEELAEQLQASTLPTLTTGDFYTQEELEQLFDTSFGAYIKGINPRKNNDGDLNYIIVKAREDGPYDDDLEGDQFTYIGEGREEKGDQNRAGANATLIEQAKESTAPVYFFFQPAMRDEIRYEGLVDVLDYEYVFDGERMVYRFTMEYLRASDAKEVQEAEQEVEGDIGDDPPLTEDEEEYTETQRRVRSRVFQSR